MLAMVALKSGAAGRAQRLCRGRGVRPAKRKDDTVGMDRSVLRSVPLFAAMSDAQLDRMTAQATARRIPSILAAWTPHRSMSAGEMNTT